MKLRAYQKLTPLEIEGIKFICELHKGSYDADDISEVIGIVPEVVQLLLNYGRVKHLDVED